MVSGNTGVCTLIFILSFVSRTCMHIFFLHGSRVLFQKHATSFNCWCLWKCLVIGESHFYFLLCVLWIFGIMNPFTCWTISFGSDTHFTIEMVYTSCMVYFYFRGNLNYKYKSLEFLKIDYSLFTVANVNGKRSSTACMFILKILKFKNGSYNT